MKLDATTRALVTGAGSGLGRAIALELATRGAKVGVSDREPDRVEAVVDEIRTAGGEALSIALDVAEPTSWADAAGLVHGSWGGLDLLVNNAGVGSSGGITEVSLEGWKRQLDINLMGVVHGCRTFSGDLVSQRRGHIVNIASFAGVAQAPGMIAYNTAKAGVIALSESLQVELAVHGVGVSVVCPAFFPTRLTESMTETAPEMRKRVERWMAGSGITAEDVARMSLDAVEADRFLVLTHGTTRRYWWMKRLAPVRYRSMLRGQLEKRVKKLEQR